jgi:hypothetical protein
MFRASERDRERGRESAEAEGRGGVSRSEGGGAVKAVCKLTDSESECSPKAGYVPNSLTTLHTHSSPQRAVQDAKSPHRSREDGVPAAARVLAGAAGVLAGAHFLYSCKRAFLLVQEYTYSHLRSCCRCGER